MFEEDKIAENVFFCKVHKKIYSSSTLLTHANV